MRAGEGKRTDNMQEQADKIVKVLQAHGLRVTPQRFAVYANLLSRSDHPSR
jgi:Fur family peroxide stress response transcriptional regulator